MVSLWATNDVITAAKLNKSFNSGLDSAKGTPSVVGESYLATDTLILYVSLNGSTWGYQIGLPASNRIGIFYNYAGSETWHAHDADVSIVGPSSAYYIRKTITLSATMPAGTLRIHFQLYSPASGVVVYGKIYRNGVAVGTERSVNNTTTDFDEDIAGWNPGDTLELWGKLPTYTNTGTARYFRILGLEGTTVHPTPLWAGTNS